MLLVPLKSRFLRLTKSNLMFEFFQGLGIDKWFKMKNLKNVLPSCIPFTLLYLQIILLYYYYYHIVV